MWIRSGDIIKKLSNGLSLDGRAIRMHILDGKDLIPRRVKIQEYETEERAQEVFELFWLAMKEGENCYEFPTK